MATEAIDLKGIRNAVRAEITSILAAKPLDLPDDELREIVISVTDSMAEGLFADPDDPGREKLRNLFIDEFLGLGPLEPLLADPRISEIQCFGSKVDEGGQKMPPKVIVEVDGRLWPIQYHVFDDDAHLMRTIARIGQKVGRACTAATPFMDARLLDGSRVNAIDPSICIDGPSLNIRRFKKDALSAQDLVGKGSCPPTWMEFLESCVKARLNIIVSGGTGSGKTTLLNVLAQFIPPYENVVTIEDSAELLLTHEYLRRMEARPANLEGEGAISIHDCVVNALRMRPDRIVVGECRSDETIEMLQAMQTGHDGSLTTVHANVSNNAEGVIHRICTMVVSAQPTLSLEAVQRQISQAVDLIIQIERDGAGARRICSVVSIEGFAEGLVTRQELLRFRRDRVDADGTVHGSFEATGMQSMSVREKIMGAGYRYDPEWFNEYEAVWSV